LLNGWTEVQPKEFLISEVNEDKLSALRLGCFIFGDRVAGVHGAGCLFGLRARLDVMEDIRISESAENRTPISLSFRLCSLVTVYDLRFSQR
jgi:hypothetical protein